VAALAAPRQTADSARQTATPAADQLSVFKAAVDLVRVDVNVVDRAAGTPISCRPIDQRNAVRHPSLRARLDAFVVKPTRRWLPAGWTTERTTKREAPFPDGKGHADTHNSRRSNTV
jgi:hypothetical protein